MEKEKFILDCDPGSDDAIAIMLALYSEKLQLKAITTVNGNRIVPKTTENALRVVEFLGADVPAVSIRLFAIKFPLASPICPALP